MTSAKQPSNNQTSASNINPMPAKIHIVIPARYQSSRLPGKPLLHIHGKPMILWVAEKASQATFADDMCIATDDQRIFDVCRQAGYDVVMTSSEHESGTDRLSEVVQKKGWAETDVVINMQGDEPLVLPKLLEQVKELLLADDTAVMATLCEPIACNTVFQQASAVKVVMSKHQGRQRALYFSRAPIPCERDRHIPDKQNLDKQSLDKQNPELQNSDTQPVQHAYRHLGLYAYRVGLLKQFVTWEMGVLERLECLEQLRVLENGHAIAIAVADEQLPAGVDTQADLDRLNAMPLEGF